MNLITQKFCDEFKVSPATVLNWAKTKLIPPLDTLDTKEKYDSAVKKIYESQKLSARANRNFSKNKFTTYLGIKDKNRKSLLDSLIEKFVQSELTAEQGILALCLKQLEDENFLTEKSAIKNFIDEWQNKFSMAEQTKIKNLFADFSVPNFNDDILGAFYQSIQSIAQKSSSGAFYTSAELLDKIKIDCDKTVCDPCCGSGSIFLNVLSTQHNTKKIFAYDIDSLALKICRVNLAMFFANPNIECHFEKRDIVFSDYEKQPNERAGFDCVITNPPWGIKFSSAEKKLLKKKYSALNTTESFSIALYNSLQMICDSGEILFFLPYSFLNVATHKKIREKIILQKNEISIKLLGKSFAGVLSEAIFLKINFAHDTDKITIEQKDNSIYKIEKQKIVPPDFFIEAESSFEAEKIFEKVFSVPHITLKDNADFALGIVTGNNEKILSTVREKNMEPIFKGSDIEPFRIRKSNFYIEFAPQKFQQTAAEKKYRAKKIVYRFINSKIICAFDADGKLFLNSANIFIPKIDYPPETIVCLFNSSVYNFIFQKKFHSAKVLKRHIEFLPLPLISQKQHEDFFALHKILSLSKNEEDVRRAKNALDKKVAEIFNLNKSIPTQENLV